MTQSIVFKTQEEILKFKESNENFDFIDHELSVGLDSTNAFEGPEKLLELWFSPNIKNLPKNWPENGLRNIPLVEIKELLKIVNCEILSKISTSKMDAYLLSESSLFVYPNKLILKTCGTTTTLLCFDKLIDLIKEFCDLNFNKLEFKNIYRIFYSRRSFIFPDKQKSIHKSWDSELIHLNNYFNEETNKSYILGDINSNNNWYLYINGTNEFEDKKVDNNNDITIELLMTDLDNSNSNNFKLNNLIKDENNNLINNYNKETEDEGHKFGDYIMNKTKLNKIFNYNNIKHDSFAFSPCGFSSNSLINNENYYTIHITPEDGWSYASFETNLCKNFEELFQTVNKVVESIKPGKFTLVVCYEGENIINNLNINNYINYNNVSIKIEHNYTLVYIMYKLK